MVSTFVPLFLKKYPPGNRAGTPMRPPINNIKKYTIKYVNTGTGVAGHVWVNDTIPADSTYVSSIPVYTSLSGDEISWHFINVKTGVYYIILKVKVDISTPGR